jgi:hypothetical protein
MGGARPDREGMRHGVEDSLDSVGGIRTAAALLLANLDRFGRTADERLAVLRREMKAANFPRTRATFAIALAVQRDPEGLRTLRELGAASGDGVLRDACALAMAELSALPDPRTLPARRIREL